MTAPGLIPCAMAAEVVGLPTAARVPFTFVAATRDCAPGAKPEVSVRVQFTTWSGGVGGVGGVSKRFCVINRCHVPFRPVLGVSPLKTARLPNSGRKWPMYGAVLALVIGAVGVGSKMF